MKKAELFFFAGELSGDLLGADLIDPHFSCVGVGGPAMQKAGLSPLFDFEDFCVMGFTSVLPKLPRILKRLEEIKRWIIHNNPKGVVLIDYAEFNLLLAKRLRKAGYRGKIIFYVCPSIWAWRPKRKEILERDVDCLLALLPFEPALFDSLKASYVEHPLVHTVASHSYKERYEGVALFPGSRSHEIRENLPIQYAAAKMTCEPLFVSIAKPKHADLIKKLAPDAQLVSSKQRYDLMQTAKGAIATCGTVILELGLHQTPTCVTYKLSPLHYVLARYLFKIRLPFYSLVNLIENRELYPEFIDRKLSPKEIARSLEKIMKTPPHFELSNHKSKNPKEEMLHALSLS